MPRLSRHTAFDISDEPDDGCYDATGQFPHLVTTELDDERELPKRRRTIAYLALTAAATSVGGVALTARNASPTPTPTSAKAVRPTAPAPRRVRVVESPTPPPTRTIRRVPVSPKRKASRPTTATAPAPVRQVTLRPVTPKPAEPAGGEFILGAR